MYFWYSAITNLTSMTFTTILKQNFCLYYAEAVKTWYRNKDLFERSNLVFIWSWYVLLFQSYDNFWLLIKTPVIQMAGGYCPQRQLNLKNFAANTNEPKFLLLLISFFLYHALICWVMSWEIKTWMMHFLFCNCHKGHRRSNLYQKINFTRSTICYESYSILFVLGAVPLYNM